MNDNIIPAGSNVEFYTIGDSTPCARAIVEEDTEVFENAFMMIDNAPYCTTNYKPVRKLNDNTYAVDLWLQDTMLIYEGIFYNSTDDLD